jgi:hypothetical protein
MKIDTNKFENHPAVMLIPTKSSTADVWIEWHKTLKNSIGKKNANIIWLKAWYMRGGKGSPASTNKLRSYMKQQGIDIETTTLESITDVVSDGIDFIGDGFKMGTYVAIGLLGIAGLGFAIALYNIAKNSDVILKDVSKSYMSFK